MASESIHYVDTDVVGGLGDGSSLANAHSTLADCETDHDRDLTAATGDDTWEHIICRGNTQDGPCTFSGWTTAADNYILVDASSDTTGKHSGVWDDGKYTVHNNDSGTYAVGFSEEYCRAANFQALVTATGTNNRNGVSTGSIGAGGADHRFYNLIIKAVSSSTATVCGISLVDSDLTVGAVWNCIVYDVVNGADSSQYGIRASGVEVDVVNCTVHNCYTGIWRNGGILNVYNSIVFDCTDDFLGTPDVIDYCASDDNDTTGTNVDETSGGADWDDAFVDYGADDFRLKAGSLMINAGATDPTGLGYGSTDIIGTSRSTWDLGAFEYMATGSILPNIHYYKQM